MSPTCALTTACAGMLAQALYDSISAGLYNVVLTSLPVLVYALLDRPATDAELLAHPQLYNNSSSLTGRAFWKARAARCLLCPARTQLRRSDACLRRR